MFWEHSAAREYGAELTVTRVLSVLNVDLNGKQTALRRFYDGTVRQFFWRHRSSQEFYCIIYALGGEKRGKTGQFWPE